MPGTQSIALNFGTRGDIIDVITVAKFCVSRFGSFGVLIRQISHFPIPHRLRWSPLQECMHAVLHYDERGEGGGVRRNLRTRLHPPLITTYVRLT